MKGPLSLRDGTEHALEVTAIRNSEEDKQRDTKLSISFRRTI